VYWKANSKFACNLENPKYSVRFHPTRKSLSSHGWPVRSSMAKVGPRKAVGYLGVDRKVMEINNKICGSWYRVLGFMGLAQLSYSNKSQENLKSPYKWMAKG
jgi:hypothetical protein